MRKRTLLAAVAATWALILVSSGAALSLNGGSPDANDEYDSGGSCHATPGTGTITATASTLSPTVGQSITATVTVTPGELTSNKIVGVFLVRALQTTGSQPSVDGWVIQTDPNGHQFNYVEKVATAVGTPLGFTWTLKAPVTAGTYYLYARAHHGGGSEYYMDFASGLTFTVSQAVAGKPEIDHQPPQEVRPGNPIPLSAMISNATVAVVRWKNLGMATPLEIAMTNTSTQSGKGWVYTATIPNQPSPTQIDYIINATGPGGSFESTYTFAVAEPAPQEGLTWDQQFAWTLTVVAILTLLGGMIILSYMLFTRKLKKN